MTRLYMTSARNHPLRSDPLTPADRERQRIAIANYDRERAERRRVRRVVALLYFAIATAITVRMFYVFTA